MHCSWLLVYWLVVQLTIHIRQATLLAKLIWIVIVAAIVVLLVLILTLCANDNHE